MKIATLMLVSTPYFITRYSAFVKAFPACSLHSIELGRTSTTYPWQPHDDPLFYDRWVLTEKPAESESTLNLVKALFRVLNQIQPDAMAIAGYAFPTMIAAAFWCTLHRKPVVIFSDSKADDAPRSWWKELPKRLILQRYQAALVAGKPHRRYLAQLGMSEAALFSGYDVVDNAAFHPDQIEALPNAFERPYFLAINRFVPKKNLLNLVSAYAQYRERVNGKAWDLVLCGDGVLRSQIEAELDRLQLRAYVHLTGFLEQQDILPLYAHAGCFIHASIQEQWGLVVNEAIAAALPVLVSTACGCFEDLVIEGVNGFGFEPENVAQLAELMARMSSEQVDLKVMGQASLQLSQNFSPEYFAEALYDAIQYAAHQLTKSELLAFEKKS
ncbi:MAG: glycosyltransferase family 4 protein [Plectolyngbya sp. WJT66-NPBG17]|jgi:glycosyltransferase involved in cell wall biosynthesis|nr:glycosyltransferase family 4 protein [Plectolyngbya sp. WJT66-NPBG17]